jgi:hypothetical protein
MDRPDLPIEGVSDASGELVEAAIRPVEIDGLGELDGMGWLGEIVAQLEADPEQCWQALESLSTIDGDVRAPIITSLGAYRERPGVRTLLRLLGSSPDPTTRTAARLALADDEVAGIENGPDEGTEKNTGDGASANDTEALPALPILRDEAELAAFPGYSAGRIVRSLVTALDGEGCGTIVISVRDDDHRRTAAFRCDVRLGILDVVGEVEPEHPYSGGLIDEWIERADGDYVPDVPELAVRLLGGCLGLNGPAAPAGVRAWVEGVVGPGGLPPGLPAIAPGPEDAVPVEEMPARAEMVLDACPSWLDRSALTFELAEEIALREGRSTPDPVRDAGAYRYLFEHSLSRRLELYARMLLWMAWVWHASGQSELARSAFALAAQLADEQYAVPSHPFTMALATRSLQAAQAELLSGDQPGARTDRAIS